MDKFNITTNPLKAYNARALHIDQQGSEASPKLIETLQSKSIQQINARSSASYEQSAPQANKNNTIEITLETSDDINKTFNDVKRYPALLSTTDNFSQAITQGSNYQSPTESETNISFRIESQFLHAGACACFACSYSRDSFEANNNSNNEIANNTDGKFTPSIAYGSLSELSDYLTTGFWEEAGTFTRRYNLSSDGVGAKNGQLTYNITGWENDTNGLSAARRNLTREVFNVYEAITGISFVEVSTDGDFRFTDNASGAYAYLGDGWYDQFPNSGAINYNAAIADFSVINLASNWYGGDSSYDGYTPQTIFHEIGHALGLGHQGQYNAGNGNPTYENSAQYGNDSWLTTMMSYWSQTNNTNVDGSFAFLQTPMAVDWVALDKLYGSQGYGSFNAFNGNTIYGVGTNISSGTSEIMNNFATMIGRTAYTLVDGSGYDILNVSNYSDNQFINLAPSNPNGTLPSTSSIGGLINNLTIGAATIIEEAIGGSGNDTFAGNSADNVFKGGGGQDVFYDSAGSDFYYGGTGDFDTVYFTDNYRDFSIENLGTSLVFTRNGSSTADAEQIWNDVELVSFNNDVIKTYQELLADITPSNTPPTANDVFITTSEDSNTVTGDFNALDPDSDDLLTYTITAAPSIGNIVINADGSFSYNFGNNFQSLNNNESADVVFEYIASDDNAADSAPATVTITINGSNDAASISTEFVVLTETNEALTATGTLTSTDVDNNDNAFTAAATTGTYGTFSIDAAGNWQFTANSAFDSLKQGESITESFNVASVDGTQSSVQIRINGSNDAPILSGTPISLLNSTKDIAYLLKASDLLQGYSDEDGDTLSITSVTTASINGTITDNGDSTWTYTPTQDLNGEVVFSFVVSDGNGGTANGNTSLTLDPVDNEVLLDEDNNGIIDGSELSAYRLFSEAGAVTITNKTGTTYNDNSSIYSDAVAATQTNGGFQVLLQGTAARNDQFYVWTTNSDGVITKGSGWISADDATNSGLEDTFNFDTNGDGLIGNEIKDEDQNGLVDNVTNYQLFSESGAITLQNNKGGTYSDSTTNKWDAVAAAQVDGGFKVLLEGTNDALRDKYLVWTTDFNGTIIYSTGFQLGDKLADQGFEELFAVDLNADGFI